MQAHGIHKQVRNLAQNMIANPGTVKGLGSLSTHAAAFTLSLLPMLQACSPACAASNAPPGIRGCTNGHTLQCVCDYAIGTNNQAARTTCHA
jgi:hypothetical protein